MIENKVYLQGTGEPGDGNSFLPLLCSECFNDEGLRLTSQLLGVVIDGLCPNCSSFRGIKLNHSGVQTLVELYFTRGTLLRPQYGGYPALAVNPHRKTEVKLASWAGEDIELLSEKSGLGIFLYGPRAWMFGEVTPLKELLSTQNRQPVIDRITSEYPTREIGTNECFYRLRCNSKDETSFAEFDSPPDDRCGSGRLDSPGFPVFYGSQDVQVCVHECRMTVDDETFIATLRPTRCLRLLDLTHVLNESEFVTEFESLDMAVHMLFLAKKHSYEITRDIARSAKGKCLDGIIYPSYFSLLRTGSPPFETVLGMSIRGIPDLAKHAASQIIATSRSSGVLYRKVSCR